MTGGKRLIESGDVDRVGVRTPGEPAVGAD
jgi:hypothetical protein